MPGQSQVHAYRAGQPRQKVAGPDVREETDPGLGHRRHRTTQYGRPETVTELREHALIVYIESMLQVGALDIERHLPGMTPAFSSTNVFAQLEATRQGAGIGVLPAFLAQRTQLHRLLADEIDIRLPLTLAIRREAVTHPAVCALWTALRQEVVERATEVIAE
ncbi:LysR substrate-binding domain-containing protein [Streptomyces sp. NPDC088560]|uniref:LysR substrate-binding domain-containing protein n=1 Tax=Streptomyces sp. NPDC088560 TaxID=3365868 RepID=UPI003820F5AB